MTGSNTYTATTLCRICEAQCGLQVDIDRKLQKITAIRPDERHVMSEGYSCIKGLTFEDFRASPDRLTKPLKRINGKHEKPQFEPISWQQAFEEIGEKVKKLRKQHGDDSVGLYFGNPIAFSLLYPIFINGFVRGLNTSKFFNTGTLDCNNKFAVADRMYGAGMALTFPDVERNRFLMIIGGNPAISKMSFINLPHPVKKLKAIVERGGQVVHLNPRRTETARQVGEHVFIRPDTDVFFLLSFLRRILQRFESGDIELPVQRIEKYMAGFDKLWQVVRDWPAERTVEITKVEPQTLHQLVDDYLAADGAALYLSTGVNQGSNGTLAFWVMEVINAITGNLDRLGGVQMGQGVIDYASVLAKAPTETNYSRIGNTPSFLEAFPCGIMADEILDPGIDQVRAMFVISGNPLLSSSNSNKLAEAFKKLELMVSIEIVQNETADFADYILPGSHFAERPDVPFMFNSMCGTSGRPWFQYVEALVEPPGEARDEIWTMHQLGNYCNAPMFGSRVFHSLVNIGAALKRLPVIGRHLPTFPVFMLGLISRFGKQGSLKKLRQYPHGKKREPLQADNYLGKRVVTEDGKVHLAPDEFIELADKRLEQSFRQHQQSADKLKMITKRERFSHNTWTHNHDKFVAKDRFSNYLYIHPQDAKHRGIVDMADVVVSSAAGEVTIKARLDDYIMPGTVALPHGWGHRDSAGQQIASRTTGVNANILACDGVEHIEPISGMTQFTGLDVDVVAL